VGATLERLETLNVTVLGYGTDAFPAFYLPDSGHPAPARVDTPEETAAVVRARDALGLPGAVVVANPLPAGEGLDPERHDALVAAAVAAAEREGVRGKAVTPFVLDFMHRESGGASLRANERLVLRNAQLAARIAVAA
jgi:pseudouridine-5'-phosphate glycosidase